MAHTQADERSPEERRTRLKKADSIRRMLAESQANQPIPSESPNRMWNCKHIENWVKSRQLEKSYQNKFSEREGEQGATVTEDRRQREQMLALSQVIKILLTILILLKTQFCLK